MGFMLFPGGLERGIGKKQQIVMVMAHMLINKHLHLIVYSTNIVETHTNALFRSGPQSPSTTAPEQSVDGHGGHTDGVSI